MKTKQKSQSKLSFEIWALILIEARWANRGQTGSPVGTEAGRFLFPVFKKFNELPPVVDRYGF